MARPRARGAARAAGRPAAGASDARVRGGDRLTARRAAWGAGAALLGCYLLTLAPGVTFWDAGEFIAAAHGFGIPHPPGTPLYVAIGRVWTLALAPLAGAARAMNLLSAAATAVAGALTAWLVVRETRSARDAPWGAMAAALCAGLMATAWANATETEVYAVSLLHVAALLAAASRAADEPDALGAGGRWLQCTAYLVALAPAVHLSALVGVPAAIAIAARPRAGGWSAARAFLLGGTLVAAAGVGRMSLPLVLAGSALVMASLAGPPAGAPPTRRLVPALSIVALAAVASSALLILLARSRHDPALNQGDPSTLAALADVVARRQYDVAGLLPRRAPAWLQLANVFQYADWQVALGWGRGVFTTPARVLATTAFALLGAAGIRAMRRDARRLADALVVLLVSGTLGVAVYLNLKAGSSLGWGVLPADAPHEARERDYFFVLGFWAWGTFAGYGALALARSRRWPPAVAIAAAAVPLAGNWTAADRSREPRASAASEVARAFLASAPAHAILFLGGDNDSYPLWYAQQVEGRRPDVALVTLSLLPAEWYQREIVRRTGLAPDTGPVPGARWQHELVARRIADAARRAGRPVAATPTVTAGERAMLGGDWRLEGVLFRSHSAGDGRVEPARVDTALTAPWLARAPSYPMRGPALVDDVASGMLALLACPRLARPWAGSAGSRDSLEVQCNLR